MEKIVIGTSGYDALRVRVDANPGAMLVTRSEYGDITVSVCAACGHTELTTNNLDKLWAAYQKSLGR